MRAGVSSASSARAPSRCSSCQRPSTRAVLPVGLLEVVGDRRQVVHVARQPVVGSDIAREVPADALGAERRGALTLAQHGDVPVSPAPQGAMAHHAELDRDGGQRAHDRTVALVPVVEVGERRGREVARARLPRVGEPVADAQRVRDQPVGTREGPGADRGVDLRGARGRGPHLGVLVPRALVDQASQLGPRLRPRIEHDAAGAVPDDHDDELRPVRRDQASVSGAPSGASNGKPTSSPCVGATSASVTGRSTTPRAAMCPGPYSSSGTSAT